MIITELAGLKSKIPCPVCLQTRLLAFGWSRASMGGRGMGLRLQGERRNDEYRKWNIKGPVSRSTNRKIKHISGKM